MLFSVMQTTSDIQAGLEVFKNLLDKHVETQQPKNRKGNFLVNGVSISPRQYATYLALKGLVTAGNHSPSYQAIANWRADGSTVTGVYTQIHALRKKGLISWETKSSPIRNGHGGGGMVAQQHIRYQFSPPPQSVGLAVSTVIERMSATIERELATAAEAINKVAR